MRRWQALWTGPRTLRSGFTTKVERVCETSELIERGVAERLAAGVPMRDGFFGGPGTVGNSLAAEALFLARVVPDADRRAELAAIVVSAAFTDGVDPVEVLARLRAVR